MISPAPTLNPASDDTRNAGDTPFLLRELQVYNWGPFKGKHRAEIDPQGSAIIGPTGSGKTTLIDALMTLLTQYPRYNLASTGGHESDRDLISYIRGVSGVEGVDGTNDHVARPGKAVTGIAATYSDGQKRVSIGGILWTDGPSNATQDLKRLWFFSDREDQTLDTLLTLHHDGGRSAVTRHERETVGLRVYSSKREYLAQVRGFFEVGENAFSLLNRAAGLKQINSIDQIFRELVLDDHSAYSRALEVAAEFDTLDGIHKELETARRQRDSLLPVAKEHEKVQKLVKKLTDLHALKELLPRWYAHASVQRWEEEANRIQDTLDETSRQLQVTRAQESACQAKLDTLKEAYLKLGGTALAQLEETLDAKRQVLQTIQKASGEYLECARRFQLETELSELSFKKNQTRLPGLADRVKRQLEEKDAETGVCQTRLHDNKRNVQEIESEIEQVRARPGSNIPPRHQEFRESLAGALQCNSGNLPFVAELVEVKPAEARWRGAIERAIGSERLRILVPEVQMGAALRWINQRDNRLHVRLQEAKHRSHPQQSFTDGFVCKLNFKRHPLQDHLKQLLGRLDRHCVDSTEALHATEYALTVQGTMSSRGGRFEKQDQRPLSEGWITGFNNRDQLNALAAGLLEIGAATKSLEAKTDKHRREREVLRHQVQLLERLRDVQFEEVDLPRIETEIANLKYRLRELTDPSSDIARAKSSYEESSTELKGIAENISELTENIGALKATLEGAKDKREHALSRRGEALDAQATRVCLEALEIPKDVSAAELDDVEREAGRELESKIETNEERKAKREQELVRCMAVAKREDTGALAETGTEVVDASEYLDRLRVLNEEALPEKLRRFLEYLNLSSGQGVTQLLSAIDNEVSIIEERIAELNATLSRVDFRQRQFLQLEPQRTVHESLRSLERAQRRLRVAALKEDEGEAHFRALRDVIEILREAGENRRTLSAQALLDPRHRLQFFVVETNRDSGRKSGRKTGSQTGSGGEKEMMASYILTASLSYALCPSGATQPRYATIVLDEAFSKSSQAAAARIISALRAFGLHPLFVTPNKEMSLLKAHTRSAILVHNREQRATLTCLSWEQIHAHSRRESHAGAPAPEARS